MQRIHGRNGDGKRATEKKTAMGKMGNEKSGNGKRKLRQYEKSAMNKFTGTARMVCRAGSM